MQLDNTSEGASSLSSGSSEDSGDYGAVTIAWLIAISAISVA